MSNLKNSGGHRRQQIGAIPFTRDEAGRVQVMLVTSRDTGRWVIPKGWPMKGKKPHNAAKREAFEEAGLVGRIGKAPVGSYGYDKRLADGGTVACEVMVFPLKVESHHDTWPEMKQRQRRWFSAVEAADAVAEEGLRALLLQMERGVHQRS